VSVSQSSAGAGRRRDDGAEIPLFPAQWMGAGVEAMSVSPPPCSPAAMVIEFHAAFGLPGKALPSLDVPCDLRDLRIRLLEEEVAEYGLAARSGDLSALADALGDIVYVAYGAAVTYGLDLDAVLAEIHRSNMSKLGVDRRPIMRADGKVLKGPAYRPPDIRAVLATQLALPFPAEAVTPSA
jgi:predicted HAD superfamily Cof-like phosphohydrolase